MYAVDAFIPGDVSRTLVTGAISPLDNGRYAVSFIPRIAGRYTIAVMLVTTPEVQTIATTFGAAVGRAGSFKLQYNGVSTLPIAWDASGPALLTALSALPDLASVGLAVTATPGAAPTNGGTTYSITFTAGSGLFLPIVVDPAFATTLLPAVVGTTVVSTRTTTGVRKHIKTVGRKAPLRREVQRVVVDIGTGTGAAATPSFALTYGGFTTSSLPFAATSTQVDTALEALDTIGDVVVSGPASTATSKTWMVTFTPALVSDDQTVAFSYNFGNLPTMSIAATSAIAVGGDGCTSHAALCFFSPHSSLRVHNSHFGSWSHTPCLV